MMDPTRGATGDPSTKLCLARVDSYDYVKNEKGELVKDENGNDIKSGLLNITLLEHNSTPREKVPFVLPFAGNTGYDGQLPELGSIACVGWKQQNNPIIIGFIPFGGLNQVTKRRTIPNLEEGEVYKQASNRDFDIDGKINYFRGARLWLDRYGRIICDTQDYKLTVGYLLSNEFTKDVSYVIDPISKQPVYYQEKLPGGVETRHDDKGNTVRTHGGSLYERVGGNINSRTTGSVTKIANTGYTISDSDGNKLSIIDGVLSLEAPGGSLARFSQGSEDVEIIGNQSTTVMGDIIQAVGGLMHSMVLGDVLLEIQGDSTETLTTGGKKIMVPSGRWIDLGDDTVNDSNRAAMKNDLRILYDAISNAVIVANDGGASLKSTILSYLNTRSWPVCAERVRVK